MGERTVKTPFTIETRELQHNMLFGDDGSINLSILKNHFSREGRLSLDSAMEIIKRAKTILSSEPNLVNVDAPTYIVGDVHGQFFDLLTIFEIADAEECKFVFMGDYVDRGDFGCEVLFYLLAMKIMNPSRFILLRGNHESRMMTESMTFDIECEYKYDSPELINEIHSLFDAFPLAALINGNALGEFLCTHGGISPQLQTLQQYNDIDRFQEPPTIGPMCDLLWSDPFDQAHPETMDKKRLEAWLNTDFVENSLRQTSVMYGYKGLKKFLMNNKLICLIRAHQVMEEGFKLHYFTQNTDIPPCITVFSAPNYCDQYFNKAAILRINKENICFEQFEYVDHPFNLPDFIDAFTYSTPMLMEQIVMLLSHLVIAVKEECDEDISAEDRQLDVELEQKINDLIAKTEVQSKERRKSLNLKKQIRAMNTTNKDWFDKMLSLDRKNESRPKSCKLSRPIRRLGQKGMRSVSDSNIQM